MRAVIIPLLFLAVMTAGAGARGETGGSVFIEELTWTELRDQIAAGKTIAIVPIGGTEQNGPHMAIGQHNLRVKLLAGKIAAALGTALVAPVLAETALMRALDPALVRTDRLRPGEGVNGDPHRATAELGALGVDLVVDETVAAIKQAVTRH